MKREVLKELELWGKREDRKPLIVEGARQVGKTWMVKEYGKKNFENTIYINFEEQTYLRNIFLQDFDTERIIATLSAASKTKCVKGKTLLFLDEIQEARNGLTSLKYFCENVPVLHVIAAGSLLGIALNQQSFPVGKVQYLKMEPMSYLVDP